MANPFVWVELHSDKAGQAKEFYKSLFGWTLQDMPDGSGYSMISGDETAYGGITDVPTKGHPKPHWLPYVGVADLDQATAKARSLGATVHEENVPVPGMGRFTIVVDPTGAEIALWEQAK